MRHYLTYIACTLAIVFAGSCVKIDINPVEQVPAGDLTTVTLQLKSSDLVATRVLGVNNLNENLIKHVQCFFYESAAKPTVVYATDVIIIKDGETVGMNSEVSNLKINIPSGKMNTLFAGDNSCMVYVVANGPVDGISVTEGTTTGDIKASTAVSLDQYEIEEGDLAVSKAAPQTSFIMDGDASVTKNQDTITGTVPLYRVAAKILVKLNVANKIVYDNGTEDVTWTPELNQIRIRYINSVTGSKLNAETSSAVLQTLSDYLQQPYQDYQVYKVTQGTTTSECTQSIPFYTYPYDWNSESNPIPSISLLIPWTSDGVTQTFEYQIPINPTKKENDNDTTTETKSLVRNTVYEMTVDVAILGGLTGKVTLNPSYIVTDWGTGAINAELSRPKYLIVDENYVVMNNENTRAVGFISSDNNKVSAVITEVIKPDYNDRVPNEERALYPSDDNDTGTETFTPTADENGYGNTNPFTVSVNKDKGTIELNHTLNNEMNSKGFDYVPYTVRVRVTMTIDEGTGDEKTFEEIIEFKQYPAMYVTAYTNESFYKHGSNYYDNNNNNPRNTFVNGWYNEYDKAQGVVNDPTTCGTVNGLQASTNANPNQYVLTVSSFSSNQPYVIADPRSENSNITLGNQSITWAESVYVDRNMNQGTGTKQLENYYPTIEEKNTGKTNTSDPNTYLTGYFISPKFRLASSYSVVSQTTCNTLEKARRRCASYQENGYPAGRWRLATYAEIELIVSLSYRGIIPALFSSDSKYWCAHGAVQGNSTTGKVSLTETGGVSVRCVYDEWYWGSNKLNDISVFTWGDAPRN